MSHGVANGSEGPGIKLNLAQQARLAADLRNAISECSERGLYNAAKWWVKSCSIHGFVLVAALIRACSTFRANEMLVSIPAAGRKSSTSTFRPRPSDAHQRPGTDFQTSTPINSARSGNGRLKNHLPELSTPSSSHRSPLPRFPSPRIHKRTKPRVSLGDFHDQPPNLIDVEHDLSRADMDMGEDSNAFLQRPSRGESPFSPFALKEEDDMDEHMMDTSSLLSFDPIAPVKSKLPDKKTFEVEYESQVEAEESDTYSLAKCYFDTKELERCKRVLQGCRSKKAMFLRLYSVYLVRSWEEILSYGSYR